MSGDNGGDRWWNSEWVREIEDEPEWIGDYESMEEVLEWLEQNPVDEAEVLPE